MWLPVWVLNSTVEEREPSDSILWNPLTFSGGVPGNTGTSVPSG